MSRVYKLVIIYNIANWCEFGVSIAHAQLQTCPITQVGFTWKSCVCLLKVNGSDWGNKTFDPQEWKWEGELRKVCLNVDVQEIVRTDSHGTSKQYSSIHRFFVFMHVWNLNPWTLMLRPRTIPTKMWLLCIPF